MTLTSSKAKSLSQGQRYQMAPKPSRAAERFWVVANRKAQRVFDRMVWEWFESIRPTLEKEALDFREDSNPIVPESPQYQLWSDELLKKLPGGFPQEEWDKSVKNSNRSTDKKTRDDMVNLGIPIIPGTPVAVYFENARDAGLARITALQETTVQKLAGALERKRGASVRELRAFIQEELGVTRGKADLLARDQVITANAEVSKARVQAAGGTKYIWSTSLDERVRDDHAALEGLEFSYDAPPVVDSRSGRTGNPGDDYQCRCVALPVFDQFEGIE